MIFYHTRNIGRIMMNNIKVSLNELMVNKLLESLYSGDKHYRVNGFIKNDKGEEVPVSNKIFNVKNADNAKEVSVHLHWRTKGHYRVDSAHELKEDESELTEGFFSKKEQPKKYSREEIQEALHSFNEKKAKTVNALKVKALDAFTAKHKGNINAIDYDSDLNKLHWHVYRSLDKHLNTVFTPNEVHVIHGPHEMSIVDTLYKNQNDEGTDKLIQKLKKYKPFTNTPTTT